MQHVVAEAGQLPDAALDFARRVSEVRTPQHLIQLREQVRERHRGELNAVFAAVNARFGGSESMIGVFYAAGEMAVMEAVGRASLPPQDRRVLRDLWEALLHAQP